METVSIAHDIYMQALRQAREDYPGLTDENAMSIYLNKVLSERFVADEINEAIRSARLTEPPVSHHVKQRQR